MKIYSLVGKSGTGKSYQANSLCMEMNIACIIDDGLLIEKGRIRAGRSAKRQETKLGAIKVALFTDVALRNEMIAALKEVQPDSILILGTSDRMVNTIALRLELPKIQDRLYIENFTTEDEREVAAKRRQEKGEHIIPAPTFQIQKDFSGYFIHPLKSIRDLTETQSFAERSVVRPTYSYLGKYTISDRAIRDIVTLASDSVDGIAGISEVFVRGRAEGAVIEIGIILSYGPRIVDVAEAFQRRVHDCLEEMTSVNILSVEVVIEGFPGTKNSSSERGVRAIPFGL
ncbi:MAG: Asp23/Gls24 family envelope stress response protein [Clostridiales Family XIII bacterium]|jgi:uncharacterized alkaline shock family protein YloU|nr:Asp23/Gls24 family envelope stress response protein [Clostridiales Family XIII bacterium]